MVAPWGVNITEVQNADTMPVSDFVGRLVRVA